jgi:pilus assembly protein Flp/PilA
MLTRISAKGIETNEVPPGLIPKSGVVSKEASSRPSLPHFWHRNRKGDVCLSEDFPRGGRISLDFNTFIERRKKMKAMRTVKRFLRDQKGTETVEWAIIIGIIAVGAIVFIVSIGGWVSRKFGTLDTELSKVP